MPNAFASADAWDVSLDRILEAGNHIVKIDEVANGQSRNGHPQIELQLSNDKGSIRDWLVITQATAGKVVALAQATGVPLPEDGDVDGLRLSDAYVERFVGKAVGIVVREEPDYQDPTKTRQRVQGYVNPQRVLDHGDVTGPTSANSFRAPAPTTRDDIPF